MVVLCCVVKHVRETEQKCDNRMRGNVPSCLMRASGRMTQTLTMMIK